MHPSRPSLTAERVARRRAAHQVLDAPLVFADPLALRIAGLDASALVHDPGEIGDADRQRRALIAARSRYVEEELAAAVSRGVRQYVILGAGLDTFAYRNAADGLRVFEIDHPATQEWKRGRLAQADIPIPPSLTFAPVDFERDRLPEALGRAGFTPDRAALFSWLGVVAYLEEAAVRETLRFAGSCAKGTTVIFDYAEPPDVLGPRDRASFDVLAARVAAIGEPWRTFFDPSSLDADLHRLGFTGVTDLDADAINRRYFSERRDTLRIDGAARIAHLAKADV